ARTLRRERAHGVQVPRARRRGPGRRGALRRARTGARARHRGRLLSRAEAAAVIPLDAIERARAITADAVHESPLVRRDVDAPCEIWLKLECLQPIVSFKLRGATSAIRQAGPEGGRAGVWTTSAGTR